MNNEYLRRINEADAETRRVLDRALRYREDLRDHKLIDDYRKHLVKLEAMRLDLMGCKA